MQATLDAFSLKAFTKALTCLSRYGEELTIHATSVFLSLSATNSAKSAYCRFKYDRRFFSRYKLGALRVVSDDNGPEDVTGQLLTKSLLSILKHRTVEKSVERCELSIVEGNGQGDEDTDTLESKLIVRLYCKHGVVKTHRLSLLTLATLLAPSVPNATNESKLTIGPRALKELIDHFPVSKSSRSDPQLIWTFQDTEISLKSIESSIDSRGRGQLSTELTISSEEFDVYDIYECPVTVAFHLREFTASIAFADSMAQSLDFRFTNPAAPLFIDVEGDNVDTLFIISTSQVHGGAFRSQGTNGQAANARKRERERSESETPRLKKPLQLVQAVESEMNRHVSNNSRGTSRVPGSMPPPSSIPNRSTFHAIASQGLPHCSTFHNPPQDEPLFLPSSQLSGKELEVLCSTGLGIENMNTAEFTEMLEGEGEEVDFSHVSQPPLNMKQQQLRAIENMHMQLDGPDSLELIDDGLSATQSTNGSDKSFHPLFED